MAEIDILIDQHLQSVTSDASDAIPEVLRGEPISRRGDLWLLDESRLLSAHRDSALVLGAEI